MGSFFSSPPTVPELVDTEKTQQAVNGLSPQTVQLLKDVAKTQSGELIIPIIASNVEQDKTINQAYHALRTRPHSYLDCNYPFAIFIPKTAEDVSKIVIGLRSLGADKLKNAITNQQVHVAVCGGAHSHFCYQSGTICY
jgi:hypothetical protein